MKGNRIKICLTCSHGGHLGEMLQLAPAFEGHDTFYFCYEAETTRALPGAYLVPNMARNPLEFLKNLVRVWRIFRKERPRLIVSTGAEIAIPVILVGKLFGCRSVYIECGAQVATPSMTGRLMQYLADAFFVQWRELLVVYGGRARLCGSLVDEVDPFPGDRSSEGRARIALVRLDDATGERGALLLAQVATLLQQAGAAVRVIDMPGEGLSMAQALALLAQRETDAVGLLAGAPPGAFLAALGGIEGAPKLFRVVEQASDSQGPLPQLSRSAALCARLVDALAAGANLHPAVIPAADDSSGLVPDWSLFRGTAR